MTRHEFLFWLDPLLLDSTNDLYCLRVEFHSNSTHQRSRTQNSTSGFSVQYVLVKTMQPVSRRLFGHTVVKSATFFISPLRDQSPPQCLTRRSAPRTGSRTCPQLVTYHSSLHRVSFVFQFTQIPSLLQQSGLVDLALQILEVVMNSLDASSLGSNLRAQEIWAQSLWSGLFAGFCHSGFRCHREDL